MTKYEYEEKIILKNNKKHIGADCYHYPVVVDKGEIARQCLNETLLYFAALSLILLKWETVETVSNFMCLITISCYLAYILTKHFEDD